MWMNKMLSISKAENGFVVECHVPIKPEKKKETENMLGSCEKQYIAKDSNEVAKLVDKLMPMLDEDYKSEDEFDAAFGEASKGKMKIKEEYK